MPTSPVSAIVAGASFTVNILPANVDPDLSIRDFIVLENGTLTLNPNSYTKLSVASLGYSGPSLASGTVLEIRRNTPRGQRVVVLPNNKVLSSVWNAEFDRRVRIQEEIDLYGAGGGFTVRLPVNSAFDVSWQPDTLFPPTRQAVYNAVVGLAPRNSPTFTGNPTAPTPATLDNSTSIATTAFVTSRLGTLAPIASPAFTGTPTVPTAISTDNSTTIANTAHVKSVLGGYALLASPTFTGTPTVPTALTTDNSTTIASTAYVKNVVTGLAPVASPTFTGTPTAPVYTDNTRTQQVSTALNVARSHRPIVALSRTTGASVSTGVFVTLVFTNEISDVSNAYNNSTGIFTAPFTGWYCFTGGVQQSGITSLVLSVSTLSNTETERLGAGLSASATTLYAGGSVMVFMNANDTRQFVVFSSNAGTLAAEPSGTTRTVCHGSISYVGIHTDT